ncbi:MAG: stage III sporulation protein AD [Firmicutes bacterium]|nr:stage III sporulation protein AD [Bacillota bacterium]
MDIIKIVFIGITGVFLSVSIKKNSPHFSLLTGLMAGLIILGLSLGYLQEVFAAFGRITGLAGIDENYVSVVLKVIGIAYIAEFGIALCKDAGEASIAGKIELGGKILILLISVPVISTLMELIAGLL